MYFHVITQQPLPQIILKKKVKMFNPLKVLGKLGKGLATVAGVAGTAAGAVTLELGGLNETLTLVVAILTALSALLASFGIGRKAREAALK